MFSGFPGLRIMVGMALGSSVNTGLSQVACTSIVMAAVTELTLLTFQPVICRVLVPITPDATVDFHLVVPESHTGAVNSADDQSVAGKLAS